MIKGTEKISSERDEQLNEHNYDHLTDQNEFNQNGELAKAAAFCITLDLKLYPSNWGKEFMNNILGKQHDLGERVKIAGALCAAQLDFDEIKTNKPPVSIGDKIEVFYELGIDSEKFPPTDCIVESLWFNESEFEWWVVVEDNPGVQYAEWNKDNGIFILAPFD